MNAKEFIARRAAQEFKDGMYINLGFGIPIAAGNFVSEGVKVNLHGENGILCYGGNAPLGEDDPCMCSAGGASVKTLDGCSVFDLAESFLIIRGGHLDMTVLGALEVDQEGNIANWATPLGEGKYSPGPGGAMDLLIGAKKVVVTMTHTTKTGAPKVLKKCSLPLSAPNAVDLIITELAVMEVTEEGLVLKEIAPGVTIEEVVSKTDADLIIPENVDEMEVA